jgi:hypothetical protein
LGTAAALYQKSFEIKSGCANEREITVSSRSQERLIKEIDDPISRIVYSLALSMETLLRGLRQAQPRPY